MESLFPVAASGECLVGKEGKKIIPRIWGQSQNEGIPLEK